MEVLERLGSRKMLPWVIGGGIGIVILVYWYSSSSSSGGSTSSGPSYGQITAANAQAAQEALAAQREADAAANATAQLNAQITATNQAQSIELIKAAGSGIAAIITAQDQIPAAAINAATAENQTALLAAAGVAASANNALPGVLEASYAPLVQYGKAVANSGSIQAINSFGSNIATPVQASASVAQSAQAAGAANTQSRNTTIGTIATIAAIAFL